MKLKAKEKKIALEMGWDIEEIERGYCECVTPVPGVTKIEAVDNFGDDDEHPIRVFNGENPDREAALSLKKIGLSFIDNPIVIENIGYLIDTPETRDAVSQYLGVIVA